MIEISSDIIIISQAHDVDQESIYIFNLVFTLLNRAWKCNSIWDDLTRRAFLLLDEHIPYLYGYWISMPWVGAYVNGGDILKANHERQNTDSIAGRQSAKRCTRLQIATS